MTRYAPPPAEDKLLRQRVAKLDRVLKKITWGRLRHEYDPKVRAYAIVAGLGATALGLPLLDGKRFFMLEERLVIQGGQLHRVAYKYQLSWPDDSYFRPPNDWIFRFDYDVDAGVRGRFKGEPHLNAHHPHPVGPGLMHYPTGRQVPAELVVEIVQVHFPQV